MLFSVGEDANIAATYVIYRPQAVTSTG